MVSQNKPCIGMALIYRSNLTKEAAFDWHLLNAFQSKAPPPFPWCFLHWAMAYAWCERMQPVGAWLTSKGERPLTFFFSLSLFHRPFRSPPGTTPDRVAIKHHAALVGNQAHRNHNPYPFF
jgi:hypothetical protein